MCVCFPALQGPLIISIHGGWGQRRPYHPEAGFCSPSFTHHLAKCLRQKILLNEWNVFLTICQPSLSLLSFLLPVRYFSSNRGFAVRWFITVFVYRRNACDFAFFSKLEDSFPSWLSHWWSEMGRVPEASE